MTEPKHAWQQAGCTLKPVTVMDDWLGPTHALVQCRCGQYALLQLIAWEGRNLASRIYAVRNVPAEAAETYLANIRRDYCDLDRKQAETAALTQAASDTAVLVLTTVPEMQVEAASESCFNPPMQHWQAINEDDFKAWHTRIFNRDAK